ncbi:protein DBF4 homolog A [Ciona intestinalis]
MNGLTNCKILSGKKFFIDPKIDKTTSQKIKTALLQLGGKVEEFLDRSVHFALTNEPRSKKNPTEAVDSPFSTKVISPTSCVRSSTTSSRWRDVVKNAGRKSSNNLMDTARTLGIRVRTVDEVWSWLQRKTKDMKTPVQPPQPINIKLKTPCLKIEDRITKPVYEEFEVFPSVDFRSKGKACPLVDPKLSKPKKETRAGKFETKGFCECCQSSYLGGESKHRKTVQHINFGEDSNNYSRLDDYLRDNRLDLQSFLRKRRKTSPLPPSGSKSVFVERVRKIPLKREIFPKKEISPKGKIPATTSGEIPNNRILTRSQLGTSPQKPTLLEIPGESPCLQPRKYPLRDTKSPPNVGKPHHTPLRRSLRKRSVGLATKRKRDTTMPSSDEIFFQFSSFDDKTLDSDFLEN